MAEDSKYGKVEVEGIPDDEPIFILRAQDEVAYGTLEYYRHQSESHGSPKEHVDGVSEAAEKFVAWQAGHDTKVPD